MARPLRIEYDGAVYHITSRGNARKPIYKEDEDRRIFLEVLHRANTRCGWNNGIHLCPEGLRKPDRVTCPQTFERGEYRVLPVVRRETENAEGLGAS